MSLDQLRHLLDPHARPDGTTAIDGVRICRADHAVGPETAMSGTVLATIAQGGAKRIDRAYPPTPSGGTTGAAAPRTQGPYRG
jgi:hypothetical protein